MTNFEDYKILVNSGNIAFYNSCEITQIVLNRKSDRKLFNLFILGVFEEKPYTNLNYTRLGRIPINNDYSIFIQRYWLPINETECNFEILIKENKWNYNGDKSLIFPKLKLLSKQFIPTEDGKRINKILKNNFHSGSYILEFFDEDKNFLDILLRMEFLTKFNSICEEIKKLVPIDLSVARDRVGNIIFQFPITITEIHARAKSTWDGVEINFAWHKQIISTPECYVEVSSTFDKNYMGCKLEDYNKSDKQIITIGNLDQINHIKFWRKEPNLILSVSDGTFIRNFDLRIHLINQEPRLYEINGIMKKVQVSSADNKEKKEKITYTQYINNNLYDAEKKQLEKTLSFKQYINIDNDVALDDIRKLIELNDENGAYLWDPYLRANDILKTLFYSKTIGVELRAIGAINKDIRNNLNETDDTEQIMLNEKNIFKNPKHNNLGLNFEFRMQNNMHGWKFHDRFLIFPGNNKKRSKVYSLGTSLNSFGKEHNILQEVLHPQPVVDAFNELWDKLNNENCIVWKFTK